MEHSVEQMRGMVGSKAGTSRWFDIPQARIDAFADLTEDRQFIHIDPPRAAETPFGGPIAHGFLTLSMLSAMAYDGQPHLANAALSVNYGFNRLRFLAPVPAGARIRAHFTLNAVDERPEGEVTLTWGVEIEIEGQEKPALAAEWINRHYLHGA